MHCSCRLAARACSPAPARAPLTRTTDARVYKPVPRSLTAHVQALSYMHVSSCYYKLIDHACARTRELLLNRAAGAAGGSACQRLSESKRSESKRKRHACSATVARQFTTGTTSDDWAGRHIHAHCCAAQRIDRIRCHLICISCILVRDRSALCWQSKLILRTPWMYPGQKG